MLKLFNKPKNNGALIEEIHITFNTAGDKLLVSALEVINKTNVNVEKVERLMAIGFRQSNEVKEWDKIKMTKDLSELIQYYQAYYPNSKFITEVQVGAICKKYNLSCAAIDRYKGFVARS